MRKTDKPLMIIVSFIIVVSYLYNVLSANYVSQHFGVFFTFMAIGILSITKVICDASELNFSLNRMVWCFVFIFFFIAPTVQYSNNDFPWRTVVTNNEILETNIIILVWCLLYSIAYKITSKKKFYDNLSNKWSDINSKQKMDVNSYKNEQTYVPDVYILILFAISSVIFVFSIVYIGFSTLLSRGEYTYTLQAIGGNTLFLIYNTFARSLVLTSMVIMLLNKKENNKIKYFGLCLIQFFYVIVLYFPTGSGRLWIMVVYMGLFLMIRKKLNSKLTFPFLIAFGIIYLAPILSVFRNATFDITTLIESAKNNFDIQSSLSKGDYDAYVMLLRTIRYVKTEGITWGMQLLSVILFWIPRSLWPSKGVGSGAMVISYQGGEFTNVSCPIIGEGYINFGIVGVILFAIAAAILVRKIDYLNLHLNNYKLSSMNNIQRCFWIMYPFIIGYAFLFLRGDLMTSLSNFIGFMLPAIILSNVIKVRNLKN